MTETEWLQATDPQKMLSFIWRSATGRKLRLFECGWCRCMPHPLTDPRSLTAVETGERFADRLIGDEELLAAREAAQLVVENAVAEQQWEQAAAAADARRCVELAKSRIVRVQNLWHVNQCHILRDLYGPLPFRPITIEDRLLSWNDGAVLKLAQMIYADRRFSDLPILADTLEEAGCTDPDILAHCRQPGEHVRGCWVVDLLLGKS